MASEPEPLITMLSGLSGAAEAVELKTGPLLQWLHGAITDADLPAVLIETQQESSALKVMPIKTDRQDAEGFARLMTMPNVGVVVALTYH